MFKNSRLDQTDESFYESTPGGMGQAFSRRWFSMGHDGNRVSTPAGMGQAFRTNMPNSQWGTADYSTLQPLTGPFPLSKESQTQIPGPNSKASIPNGRLPSFKGLHMEKRGATIDTLQSLTGSFPLSKHLKRFDGTWVFMLQSQTGPFPLSKFGVGCSDLLQYRASIPNGPLPSFKGEQYFWHRFKETASIPNGPLPSFKG